MPARRHLWQLLFICLLLLFQPNLHALHASEQSLKEQRFHLARHFSVYDFESRGDNPASRDRDADGWPDFWEPVIDTKHPPYLADNIRIVTDKRRPGLYRGVPGHVLRIPFDGTRVQVRTRVPKVIDADLAYVISAYARSENLNFSITEIVLTWMHVDKAQGERILGHDTITVPPGQLDWMEQPLRLRINTLPREANAVRLSCQIRDDPSFPGADRHGVAWFDDIRIVSRPKINVIPSFMDAPFASFTPKTTSIPVKIQYLGLIDNVPTIRNGKKVLHGKQYSRDIEIMDMNGNPPTTAADREIPMPYAQNRKIDPGVQRHFEETIRVPLQKLGVYYLTVNLFGYDRDNQARVTQVVGLWAPPRERPTLGLGLESASTFGVNLDDLPLPLLQAEGYLSRMIRRLGVYHTKTHVWPTNFQVQESQPYLVHLNRELRDIRGFGVRITGSIPNTPMPLRSLPMQDLMTEKADLLSQFLSTAIQHVGTHVEYWLWGTDTDPSFTNAIDYQKIAGAQKALTGMTSAIIQGFPVQANLPDARLPSSQDAQAVLLHIPADVTPMQMAGQLSRLTPERLQFLNGEDVYPPPNLMALAPPKQEEGEKIVEQESGKLSQEAWVGIDLRPVPRHTRHAGTERRQMRDMARKAVLARALGFNRIFLGSLTGDSTGLLQTDITLAAAPRPAFLALRVLDEYLGGATYLGSFQLRDAFDNYVFRHRDGERAIIVVWYTGKGDSGLLDIGGGTDLHSVDMAGNRQPVSRSDRIQVRRSPLLLMGMSAKMALTRMSIRIDRLPALYAQRIWEKQVLTMKNYIDQQLPGTLQLTYAADSNFDRERNWRMRPEKIQINIRRGQDNLPTPARFTYEVRPDQNSVIGVKWVQIKVDLNTVTPVRLRLLRKTTLTSDLHVKVERLGDKDPRNIQLQLWVKWIPHDPTEQRRSISLRPFYRKKGLLTEWRPPVSVSASTGDITDMPPSAIKLVIPQERRLIRTWVGLAEEEGSRFYQVEVTDLIAEALKEAETEP